VEKPKKIGQINPKTAVETTGIQSPIHERVMPLNHHEAFALEAIHRKIQLTECASSLRPNTRPRARRRKSSC
jgi:hypothetical protein